MNRTFLVGHLVDAPKLEKKGETTLTKFSIAVNKAVNGEKKTNYFPIVVFGKQGENCHNFLSKGSKVAIEGELDTYSYADTEGKTHKYFNIVATRVEYLSEGRKDKTTVTPISEEDYPF